VKSSTLPSGTVTPQFDIKSYQEYLLTGTLPSTFGDMISTATVTKYQAARAALPGAICWNDVHLIGYPQLAVTVPGQPASKQPDITTEIPADTAATMGHSGSGNKLASDG
jgi:hypothetical protein